MKEFEIVTKIKLWSFEELHPNDRQLVEMAIKATEGAYAEYSHFYVGAAARLADGTIVTGANQENAAFPSGLRRTHNALCCTGKPSDTTR